MRMTLTSGAKTNITLCFQIKASWRSTTLVNVVANFDIHYSFPQVHNKATKKLIRFSILGITQILNPKHKPN